MSAAYGVIPNPFKSVSLSTLLPRHALLRSSNEGKDQESSSSTLFKISRTDTNDYTLSTKTHPTLLKAMHQIFNNEVLRGDTYPQEEILTSEQFTNYFFGGETFVLIKGHYENANQVQVIQVPSTVIASGEEEEKDKEQQELEAAYKAWDSQLLGLYYIRPNFLGRCAHICNGGFMVNPTHRGLGIGGILGKSFLRLAPAIGYKASMFNLVFVTNTASVRLWQRLGFKQIGLVPNAGRLNVVVGKDEDGNEKREERIVDAIQFYWDFENMVVPAEY